MSEELYYKLVRELEDLLKDVLELKPTYGDDELAVAHLEGRQYLAEELLSLIKRRTEIT